MSDVFGKDGGFVTTTVDGFLRWSKANSIWPLTFGLACCAIEMMNLTAPRYDLAQWGSEAFRASPRQADLMIVSGRLCNKMVPVAKQVYQQMAEPKWVVAMGACASTGGIFDNYAVVQGVDNVIPVDVYIPGCPPTPDAVIHAIQMLRERIKRDDPKGGLKVNA
ncbi:MAG TPA: NADH-quinone oxidoreductase subunit B family protein [Symbiobacteriaceae bacterium]|nr:NADH-quinone oxidoreductase subunit B family protein [Symbiobacteriaceae bacterium]